MIDWADHAIDFGVILAADLSAAFVAFKVWEHKRSDREKQDSRAESSLNDLCRLVDLEVHRYTELLRIVPDDPSAKVYLPKDISNEGREFEDLRRNRLFWKFPNGRDYRLIHTFVMDHKMRTILYTNAGDVRNTIMTILTALKEMRENAEKQLNA